MKRMALTTALVSLCSLTAAGLGQFHVTVSTVGPDPIDQRITVYDPVASKTIISASGGELYDDWTYGMAPTSITIIPSVTDAGPNPDLCDGFDIVYVFDNTASMTEAGVGELKVPGCVFGTADAANNTIRSRNFEWLGTSHAQQFSIIPPATMFNGNGHYYPDEMFAPLMYLHSGNYAIGVSVNYPMVDPECEDPNDCPTQYAHGLATNTYTFGGSPAPWVFSATVSRRCDYGAAGTEMEGTVPPGQSRTYTVSVRIKELGAYGSVNDENSPPLSTGVQDWLEVFKPYKAYFDARYKGQNYKMKACPAPVLALSVGGQYQEDGFTPIPNSGGLLTNNPYTGFGPWVTLLDNEVLNGWNRFMFWTPSGCFFTDQDTPLSPPEWNPYADYPFQFMSRWSYWDLNYTNDIRILQPYADGTQSSGVGGDLGMWWGHSSGIMTSWPTAKDAEEPFSPYCPTEAGIWMDELELAILDPTGPVADMIGLDAWGGPENPVWLKYFFTRDVISAYPNIGFIQEGMPCDVMATLSAGYQPHQNIKTPNYMAHLLIPGLELWGTVDASLTSPQFNGPAMQAVAETWASWGYTPVCFGYGIDITGDIADMTADVPDVIPCSMLVPTIYTDLPNSTVLKGRSNTSLEVIVGSPGSHIFTWQKDTGGGWATVTDANATGINTNKLTFTDVEYTNGGSYRLKIEYGGGNCVSAVVYSNDVAVRICGPKDFNGDSIEGDADDITAFYACLGGTCCPNCWNSDFDGDGDFGTNADIDAFFNVLNDDPC